MSARQNPNDFLKTLLGRPVVVKLNSGVDYRGVLSCLDGYMNIALEQTEEYVHGQLKNKYGDTFIRGNNVLYISTQKSRRQMPLLSDLSYALLVAPAAFVVTLAWYYCTWMAWEMFRNNQKQKMEGFTLVKQGAEAKLHVGSFLGQKAIAKERFPKKYRHPSLDQQLTKKRLKAELKLLIRCKKLGIRTPTIFFADADKSLFIMEYLSEAVTSRDLINAVRASEAEADRNRLTDVLKKMGETVAKLHNDGVIHGDLTTSNILVDAGREDELVMIDFGLGFSEGTAEDKGVDLYVLERAFHSTHPNMEDDFAVVLDGYRSTLNKGDKKVVVAKYEEIRMRGRKRTMVG